MRIRVVFVVTFVVAAFAGQLIEPRGLVVGPEGRAPLRHSRQK